MSTNFFDDRYPKVDRQLMEDGVKVDFGGGFKVQIRHLSSKKVEAVRARKLQDMKIGNRNKELNAEQRDELTKHVLAYGVISGWEGGDAPTFSPELALEVMNERPEFLDDVVTVATSYESFREEMAEDASGNSSTSSSGDSGTGTSSKRSKTTS